MKWLLIILALVYLLSPYDLIPGFHALGWLDDIVILFLLFRYLSKTRPGAGSSFGTYDPQEEGRAENNADARETQSTPRSPYDVLNLPPDADQETIKAAYRKLANQYHPDKVSHLGKEFRDLAEQKFKDIQDAYQKLVR